MRLVAATALALSALAAAAMITPAPALAGESPDHIWRSTCGYCHGGPMNAPELRGRVFPEQVMVKIVREGAAGMPPFPPSSIGETELRALARWITAQPAPKQQP